MFIVYLFLILGLWLLFLVGVIWFLGIFTCRYSAWWNKENRIQKYITISNPRLAGLLIPKYIGYNNYVRTNIPLLYNRYFVNQYPSRLSILGLIDYCVTAVLAVWYGACITAYFWLGWFDYPMIPLTVMLFMIHAALFTFLNGWNARIKWDEIEVISRAEMRKRKRDKK